MIISTGIATLSDIEEAVNACREEDNDQIILLKCTSSYPTPFDEVDLKTIPNLKETFGTEVGLSDHTLGSTVPTAAVALGARVVEKHFILDKSLGGPDAEFSLKPEEFSAMVQSVRDTEKALGSINYNLTDKNKSKRQFSRSLFVVENMKQGDNFTKENVRSIRPGYGIAPKHLEEILGKKVIKSVERGTPLTWNLIG
jgi:pseudaminic acid synthase